MKKYILLLAIVFALSTAGMAEARKGDCPPGQQQQGGQCSGGDGGGDGGGVTIGDVSGGAGGKGGNANAAGGSVFIGNAPLSAGDILSPSATGGSVGDITNKNVNKNENTNLNVNSNKATSNAKSTAVAIQGQDQKQGQVQGQDQGQGQAQSVDNTIVIEDNSVIIHPEIPVTYNHISPDIGKTSADMATHGKTMQLKVLGSVDKHIDSITRVHAAKLAKGADDVDVVESILFENDFRTTMISKGAVGQFMGFIYLIPDGDEVTLAGMEGKAYLAAMDAGATHYTMEHASGIYVEGSKAGIDFGGSASVAIAADGSAVIAPGATFGYSKAWSSNEYRPGVIITLYFDHTLTITPAK